VVWDRSCCGRARQRVEERPPLPGCRFDTGRADPEGRERSRRALGNSYRRRSGKSIAMPPTDACSVLLQHTGEDHYWAPSFVANWSLLFLDTTPHRRMRQSTRRFRRRSRINSMLCRRCGQPGVFDITCTTATKVYRRRECRSCRTVSRLQHAALSRDAVHPAACECCGNLGRTVVDHCHETGRQRGYLCVPCNRSLGMLGDTPEALRRALDYLGRRG
jgi:hypothetical protein